MMLRNYFGQNVILRGQDDKVQQSFRQEVDPKVLVLILFD